MVKATKIKDQVMLKIILDEHKVNIHLKLYASLGMQALQFEVISHGYPVMMRIDNLQQAFEARYPWCKIKVWCLGS